MGLWSTREHDDGRAKTLVCLLVCGALCAGVLGVAPASGAPAGSPPRIVAVEVYSDDPANPGKTIPQAPIPWARLGLSNPHKGLTNAQSRLRASADIQGLRDGDVLVIGFHSNPRGFGDGKAFVEWKDFWSHFGIAPANAPRLRSVVVCGCMISFTNTFWGTYGIVDNIPVDANGVNHIRRCLNAEGAFVSKVTYNVYKSALIAGTSPFDEAATVADWLKAGKSLDELKTLGAGLGYFHYLEDPLLYTPPPDLSRLSPVKLQGYIDLLRGRHRELQGKLTALTPSEETAAIQIRTEQRRLYQEVLRLKAELAKR